MSDLSKQKLFNAVKVLDPQKITQALDEGANPLDTNNEGQNAFDIIMANPVALEKLGSKTSGGDNWHELKNAISKMSQVPVKSSEQLKSFGKTVYNSFLTASKNVSYSNTLSTRAGQYGVSLNENVQQDLYRSYLGSEFMVKAIASSFAWNFLSQNEKNKSILNSWVDGGRNKGTQEGLDLAAQYSIKQDGTIVKDGNGGFVWGNPDFFSSLLDQEPVFDIPDPISNTSQFSQASQGVDSLSTITSSSDDPSNYDRVLAITSMGLANCLVRYRSLPTHPNSPMHVNKVINKN